MYALEALTGGFGECVMFNAGIPENLFEEVVTWLGKDSVNCAGTCNRDVCVENSHFLFTKLITPRRIGCVAERNCRKPRLLCHWSKSRSPD